VRAAVIALALLGACYPSNAHCGDGFTDPGLGEQCDDGNTISGDGCSATCQLEPPPLAHVMATWQLADIDPTGQITATTCPPGFDTVALHDAVATLDGVITDPCTTADSSCFIDLFNCADGAGTSADLPPQPYLTWIEVVDHSVSTTYATSTAALLDLTNADQTFTTVVLENGGYFKVRWSLVGEQSGAQLSCDQTGASSQIRGSIQITATSGSGAFSDKLPCEQPLGYTVGLPPDTYTVVVDALNNAGQTLSPQPPMVPNAVIATQPNAISDLGHFVIPISGM
jgi:cysteine-rich repeat protein